MPTKVTTLLTSVSAGDGLLLPAVREVGFSLLAVENLALTSGKGGLELIFLCS